MDGRGKDDRRMHEGRERGPGPEIETGEAAEGSDAADREQESALGGEVATRSNTAPTPEEERTR